MYPAPSQATFSNKASWVWGTDDPTSYNIWRYFRRSFVPPTNLQSAKLLITADSHYECYVNRHYLGQGPIRAFPFAYHYDVYDIVAYLHPGELNVIGALGHHIGDHTLSYIKGRPGFLCEIILEDTDGAIWNFGTDAQWTTLSCKQFIPATPRISPQYGFEEQVDARLAIIDWDSIDLDDSEWSSATIIGAAECAPWTKLTPRPIPFLTEYCVYPTQVIAVELARPRRGKFWSLDLREIAGLLGSPLSLRTTSEHPCLIFSELIAPCDCELRVWGFPSYEDYILRVNDQIINLTQIPRPAIALHKGANLVMLRNTDWPSLLFESSEELVISADRFVPSASWAFFGPDDKSGKQIEQYWSVTDALQLLPISSFLGISAERNRLDVSALTSSQNFFAIEGGFCSADISSSNPRQRLPGMRTVITQPRALLHNNEDWTIIYPQPDGDVHLVIDFEQEIIGYVQIEIDASEGTIIDANLFEGIDDGGIFWMKDMRNSFRYVSREGFQIFRSRQRRGFRYLSLTFRSMTRAIRIRQISTMLNTYPVEKVGSFNCSDDTLTRIWNAAAYTVQLCMLDTYVDCPGYEQVFWVGDARISALVNAIAFGAFELTEHSLRLVGQSLTNEMTAVKPARLRNRTHITTSHVVSGWFDEIPMWTFLWIWTVWEHYQFTNDLAALADLYADIRECLSRCKGFLTDRDLLDVPDVWNLVDWAAMDLERSGEVISNTAMMAQSLDFAGNIAAILNLMSDADEHFSLAERLRIAVNQWGWSDEYQGYFDTVRDEPAYERYKAQCQSQACSPITMKEYQAKQRISEQTNTLALLCNCVPQERQQMVLRFVLAAQEGKFVGSSPEQAHLGKPHEVVPVGSPWFLFFTLETLFKMGYETDAIGILREQWGRMLKKGATTFWETFPGFNGQVHWSRSLCHGWSAAPAYFFTTHVLGIIPIAPGYQRIRIAPRPFDLRWASGVVPTPHGPIVVSWHIDETETMRIEYSVPNGCEVEIVSNGGVCSRANSLNND